MRKLGQHQSQNSQDRADQGGSNGRFEYGAVNNIKIGPNWLEGKPIHDYRKNLVAALKQARDNYVKRDKLQKGSGASVAQTFPSIMDDSTITKNLKTVNPEIPNFASERNPIHKFAGACIKKQYTRFFTVDQEHLKYYAKQDSKEVKRSLELKDSQSFIQLKDQFMELKKAGKTESGDEWAQPDLAYRIGIKLPGRKLKPIFFYSASLHDAKILLVNIKLYGNQFKTLTMSTMIEQSYNLEKATRFASIISLMCFAKEKRFVQMHGFQELAIDMVEISKQADMFRKQLMTKWFANLLTEDEKPTVRSGFRTAEPKPLLEDQRVEINEKRINKYMQKLKTFIKSRRLDRQPAISKEINKQIQEEQYGIPIDELQMTSWVNNQYQRVLNIVNTQSSLIFDSDDCYKYMIIENKSLDPLVASATTSSIRKRQAENLIRKIDIGEVSFISTDLDQVTQFDFANKMKRQSSYTIRLYGKMLRQGQSDASHANIAPSQIGLDVLRTAKAKYRISVKQIKFPAKLSQQSNDKGWAEKISLLIKLFQFTNDFKEDQEPNFFECTSHNIKIKGCQTNVINPSDQHRDAGVFKVDKLSGDAAGGAAETFAIGLAIRMNENPIPLVCEKYIEHETLNSYYNTNRQHGQVFSYEDVDREQRVILTDFERNQYEIVFVVNRIHDQNKNDMQLQNMEREGKRLLVGRYALYDSRPVYVKGLSGNPGNNNHQVEIIETIQKKERKVDVSSLALLETSGVNIFKLDEEPLLVQNSVFEWKLDLKVTDKRILNAITSKINYKQVSLQLENQDMNIPDPLNTIEGNIIVSMIETKGLITQKEVNRRLLDASIQINPQVEVRLMRMSSEQEIASSKTLPVTNTREVQWGKSTNKANNQKEFVVDLGQVNHSGEAPESQVEVERSKRSTVVRKTVKKSGMQDQEKLYVHIIVRNAIDDEEIGESKIELDELIDTNLQDLAKEFCVCINRSHLIQNMLETKTKGLNEQDKQKVTQEMSLYTDYSGIIRFQTLFQPTKDTSLRFAHLRDTRVFKTPKQLLHFEYLLEKSDFDNYKFKIPQIEYNPNQKNLGESLINLAELIKECKNPKIQNLLRKIQTKDPNERTKQDVIRNTMQNIKITDDIIKELDSSLTFQSPFEKLYITLKLQRKERPFIEQIFFSFKNMWEIYSQTVKNQAFDSLNLNEWFAFIHQISSTNNFEEMDQVFDRAADSEDLEKDQDGPNISQIHNKSVSFVGEMVKQMNQKAAGLKRQSTFKVKNSEGVEETNNHNFSLVLAQEWQKEGGNQNFVDLVALIKSGIPSLLRTVVWSDLMKSNLIELEERKNFTKNYPKKFNKSLSTFQNFQDISLKYDSVAFRQIDQDISDFKFPAFYFEDVMDQNTQTSTSHQYDNMPSASSNINRMNKLKHDKQQMRKLLRVLLVWGKNFQREKINYQLCYPTGFLKVVHRFINLMSIEDAFWILVGFIRQYPRLWCLQDSSMLNDAKSNFRFEMTSIKAIIEAKFPLVSQKLYQAGLSVESLVYDSMTSLYSDYFHSSTLLRIWDQMIFFFNTTDASSKRRGIWLILAPALLIIKEKEKEILDARSPKEIIAAYNNGCAIDYNPNEIIRLLNQLIDETFLTDSQQKPEAAQAPQDGGTGSGIFGRVFGKKSQVALQQKVSVMQIDLERQTIQTLQNIIFDEQRFHNKVISDFLFHSSEEAKNMAQAKPGTGNPKRADSDDGMDFDEDMDKNSEDESKENINGLKPQPHQALDYKHWRIEMLPAIQNQFLMTEEIMDDDVHEFEDQDIYQKQSLDIKVLHVYLHSLDSWYGTDDETNDFRIQIQYGRLHTNGKFEVKSETKNDQDTIRSDSTLQYFHQFKYAAGYNFIKVKIMKIKNDEKVCHCYIDLRGHQRGKFVYFQKTMNAKEYTQNAESQFPLTQLNMSLFLESKKEKSENQIQHNTQDVETMKMTYMYSLQKYEQGLINIYKSNKERYFQNMMIQSLQRQVQFDYSNFKQYLQQDVVMDILNNKYNYTEMHPKTKFGHLTLSYFKNFIQKCMSEYAAVTSVNEQNQVYYDFIKHGPNKIDNNNISKEKKPNQAYADFIAKSAFLDTNNVSESLKTQQLQLESNEKEANLKFFSLRTFIFSVLFQSPITVKEKLDILYDLTDVSNKFTDGIDLNSATMIYQLILQQHLYYLPFNELRTQVENVFNRGEICGIIGAFWSKKRTDEIKYDMKRDQESGVYSLEDFLNDQNKENYNQMQLAQKFSTIDISQYFQETFNMHQNLFGNKVLDFNDDTSPFNVFNNIFASTGKSNLGELLLKQTKTLGEVQAKKYRLCLLSQIAGGERVMTEIHYDLEDGKLIVPDDKQPNEQNKFKRFFMRNINILNLQGASRSLGKFEFMEGSTKIPFVYDLMRAETFWQDRKLDRGEKDKTGRSQSVYGTSHSTIASLKMKKKFMPVVNVFVSDREKIFIFKFENRTMSGRTDQTTVKELVPKQIFLFEIEALFLEDIVLDMRDRMVTELTKIQERGMSLSKGFINEIEGKMEFFVRRIYVDGKLTNQLGVHSSPQKEADKPHDSVVGNTHDLRWVWTAINDFDRIEKFSDDEVHEDEVVFKLAINKQANEEEVLDEKPLHLLEGYDCFSIYKHADNSYEWRLCKIVGKELKPEFKMQGAIESFVDFGKKKVADKKFFNDGDDSDQFEQKKGEMFGENYRTSVHESDKYFYYLEFQHLKLYGREMWCKRRREDIIFSARYSRDIQSFEKNCYKFIMDTYAKEAAY